jgi:protoporphyrinogen oxidase
VRIAVIGGGVMGLATAFYVTRAAPGVQVDVYETDEQPGGLSTYQDFGEFTWDRFYHCILPSDLDLIAFIRDLGLGARLQWGVTRTGFFRDARVHSISNTMEFLRFPLLGPVDKLRLGATLAWCGRIRNWRRLESELASDWLVRMCGRRVYEVLWRPLLRAKYGDACDRVSAVAIWAAIRRLYSARQSGLRHEMLGYVDGGYCTILARAVEGLRSSGGKVHLGTTVDHVRRHGTAFRVSGTHGSETYDRVVVTVPPAVAARLLPDVTIDHQGSGRIEYLGVVCLVLVLDRALSPFYVLNVADAELPFTGVIEMSNLVDSAQTAGRHLVYVPRYLPATHSLFRAAPADVRALFVPGLRTIVPEFREEWIVREVVSRAARVQPLHVVGYSRLVADAGSVPPGLHVVNTSVLVNATVNNDEVVRLARQVAHDVLTDAPRGRTVTRS